MRPITILTHKDIEWSWGEPQDKAFNQLKKLLTEAPVLGYYDPNADLVIQCDASAYGIGAALMQRGNPLAYASRALTDTESRYSIIEKEMLAIVFALEKWHQFTYGRPVVVHSDHKPLRAITKKPLDRAPKRLQTMLIRALAYDIDVQYLEGKKMLLADTLSRAYIINKQNETDTEFETVNVVQYLPMRAERINDIRNKTRDDSGVGCSRNNDFVKFLSSLTPFYETKIKLLLQAVSRRIVVVSYTGKSTDTRMLAITMKSVVSYSGRIFL